MRLDPEEGGGRGVRRAARPRALRHHPNPGRSVWYASLAGSHIARIDRKTGEATIVEPPTPQQGARRIWSDARGAVGQRMERGQVSCTTRGRLVEGVAAARRAAAAYAVYVDDRDAVWLTDFTANAIVRFDPPTETFESFAAGRRRGGTSAARSTG